MTSLDENDLATDPIEQFNHWFSQAKETETSDATAFVLSTIDENNHPDSRVVLLKEVSSDGYFIFFTNYQSQKGKELASNPYAAINFLWPLTDRQVRIRGIVSKVSAQVSAEYFSSRPRMSCISALASPQSSVISTREELITNANQLLEEYPEDNPIPCPEYWGGFQLKPSAIEFWQAGEYRLHDRFLYAWDQQTSTWTRCRLAP